MPELAKLTNRIELVMDGEPLNNTQFIVKIGKLCSKFGIAFYLTTNGRRFEKMRDSTLKHCLANVQCVKLSYDDFKIRNTFNQKAFFRVVNRLKVMTQCYLQCNLVVSERMFDLDGYILQDIVDMMYRRGIGIVLAILPRNVNVSPKRLRSRYFGNGELHNEAYKQKVIAFDKLNERNAAIKDKLFKQNPLVFGLDYQRLHEEIKCPDILKYRKVYDFLLDKYPTFHIDELTQQIFEQNSYTNWKKPCSYLTDSITINAYGLVLGCPYDCNDLSVFYPANREMFKKLNNLSRKKVGKQNVLLNSLKNERYNCPYLSVSRDQTPPQKN
jgi:hypothetical protein